MKSFIWVSIAFCFLLTSPSLLAASRLPQGSSPQNRTAKTDEKEETVTIQGTVESRGISLEGVELVLYYEDRGKSEQKELGRVKPEADGQFSFSGSKAKFQPRQPNTSYFSIICFDKNKTLIGGVNTYANFRNGNKFRIPFQPVLMEFENKKIQIVGHDGKPIGNKRIETSEFGARPFSEVLVSRTQNRYVRNLELKYGLEELAETDKDGFVTIRMPKKGTSRIEVATLANCVFSVDVAPDASEIILDSSSKISGVISCDDSEFDKKTVAVTLYHKQEIEPQKQYWRRLEMGSIGVDANGKFSMAATAPGKYQLSVRSKDNRFYTGKPLPFEVKPNGSVELPAISFQKGNAVSGRVVDKKTGKGVPDVFLSVYQRRSRGGRPWSAMMRTDENGNYTVFSPPGKISFNFSKPPNSKYRTPSYQDQALFSEVEVLEGEDKKLPNFVLDEGVLVKGIVVDKKGNPVPEVNLAIYDTSSGNGMGLKSNNKGEFRIENVNEADLFSIRASSLDGYTSNGALTISPKQYLNKPVKLTVSKDFASYAKGIVVDTKNRPIKDFEINGRHNQWFVSATGQGHGIGASVKRFAKPSKDGSFQTYAMQPGDTYTLLVRADGYKDFQLQKIVAKAGETFDLGKITLKRSNLTISGIVVDSTDKPLGNVRVFGAGESKLPISGRSDDSGKFNLNGWPEMDAYIFAEKDGFQFQGQLIRDVESPAKIRLQRLGEPSALKIKEQPYGSAERQQLCKDLLMQLYELPADKRTKIDFVILMYLAKVDPQLAMKLVSLKENAKYRSLVAPIAAEFLLDTNPDEAIAIFSENRTRRSSFSVFNAASRADLKLDTRRKLTGLYQEHMALTTDSSKIYKMAQLAKLLKQVGEEKAANDFANQAFQLAEKLSGNDRESFVMGVTAEFLSVFDLVRSRNLVNKMKETAGTSKDRHLGGIAFQIASQDPDSAIKILSNISPRYAPRVLHEIAKTDLPKALKEVERLFDQNETKDGCDAMLAVLVGGKKHLKPGEAAKKIDYLYNVYMSHSDEFRRYSNFGFENGFAGYTAVTAKRLGLNKQLPIFPLKALASRRGKSDVSGNIDILNSTVKLAKYLAMVDRSVSRFLLNKIRMQENVLGGGGSYSVNSTEYLIAWALTDTKVAKKVFADMLADELKKNDVLSQSNLTRPFMILANTDLDSLLREMTRRDAIWYPGRE